MKQVLVLIFLAFLASAAGGQTVAKSIYVEYGYTNIPKESVALQTMFGYSRYGVYADDKYLKVESYQSLPTEPAQAVGPTLRSLFIKERATNEIFLCVAFDTVYIRMTGGEEERASFHNMTETFNSGSASVYGSGLKKDEIQGFECSEILVRGNFSDTISAFVTNQVILDPAIEDFPLFVANGDAPFGLMLGRNEVLKGNILEFRAVQLEINQPKNVADELAMYQLVSKAEGERRMKAALSKMMGLPSGSGKN